MKDGSLIKEYQLLQADLKRKRDLTGNLLRISVCNSFGSKDSMPILDNDTRRQIPERQGKETTECLGNGDKGFLKSWGWFLT